MPARRRLHRPRRSRRSSRLLLAGGLGAVVTVVVVAVGVAWLGDADDVPPRAEPYRSVPLEEYDASASALARAPFCDRVDSRAAAEAVGGEVTASESWGNGETAELEPGLRDVAHEVGCAYTGADASARAWLFVPPVDATRAQALVAEASAAPGCSALPGPAYGSPTLALSCADESGTRVSYRGLFGDAWLVCERTARSEAPADAVDRAGRWCVAVARAAAA